LAEHELERSVSRYIGHMTVLWLPVDDPAGPTSDRGIVERGAIALLSNFGRTPIDQPSPEWLGRDADRRREEIRLSGLWNVNHVREHPSSLCLDVMRRWM
jgi:hypothetical protein